MLYHSQSEDYRPLFWFGGRPVYAHVLLIVMHILAMVITALCMSFLGSFAVFEAIVLDTYQAVFAGQAWRLLSYVIFLPSIWFVFAMGFLYFAGREVEQFIGWKAFLKLYARSSSFPR